MAVIRLSHEADYALMTSGDDQPESLLSALRAVLTAAGRQADPHDLAGASGLAFLFTWADDEPCPARQVLHGRAEALDHAAKVMGMISRPLHPRGADGGASCGAFERHFADSYAPLMITAIEHDQPLLCWGGWDESEVLAAWGVLTRYDPQWRRFGGWTVAGQDGPVWLARPPRAVDVVERVLPQAPPARLLLVGGLHAGATWATHPTLVAAGVHVGAEAMDRWAEKLRQPRPFWPADEPQSWWCHHQLTRYLSAARISAYEFIYRHAESAPTVAHREACQRLELLLGEQVELMAESYDPQRIRQAFEGPSGRADLADTVARLADLERDVQQALAPLAG